MNPTNDNDADDKLQTTYNPLSVMQEGERVICEVKRHPIGLIGLYATVGLILVVVWAAVVLAPHFLSSTTQQTKMALAFGGVIVTALALLYAYIAQTIYKANRWVVTSDSITQITQAGLFNKHMSQLSLANLEDVTTEQNGILQTMFGFGTLKAETAGERSKFVFPYCPKPDQCAKEILAAREAFILNEPAAAKRANDKLSVPQPQMYVQPQEQATPYQQPATPPQQSPGYDPTQPASQPEQPQPPQPEQYPPQSGGLYPQ